MGSFRQKLFTFSCLLMLALIFIAPLKLASISGLPEIPPDFPASFIELLILNWPLMFFPLFSGLILLLTLCSAPLELKQRSMILYTGGWMLVPLVAFIGAINASTMDFVYMQIVHLAGLATFVVAVGIQLEARPEMRYSAASALACSTVIVCIQGLQQYFGGLDDTAEFMRLQLLYYGDHAVGNQSVLNAYLADKRIFGTFPLPNSLAGFLLLTSPVCLYSVWRWCRRVEPVNVSRMIFVSLTGVILFTTFALTRSRAAVLCLMLTLTIFAFIYPFPIKARVVAAVLLLLCVIGGAVYISMSRRGFISASVRIDYYLTSLKIMMNHPFAGSGWGDFFHDYMRLKSVYHQEAPHSPHNFVFSFAAQTGISGLILSLFLLFYPLVERVRPMLKRSKERKAFWSFKTCLLAGLAAWTLHSMLDVNLQIPASAATAGLCALLLLYHKETENPAPVWIKPLWYIAGTALACLVLAGSIFMLRGDYAFSQLRKLCTTASGTTRATPETIKRQLLKTSELMPCSPFPWENAAMYMLGVGDLFSARQFMEEAVKRSPERPGFYFQLYRINKAIGDEADATKNLLKARELFPNNPKYRK
jgi:hypothetical protein